MLGCRRVRASLKAQYVILFGVVASLLYFLSFGFFFSFLPSFNLLFLSVAVMCTSECWCMNVSLSTRVEVIGQLCGVGFPLHLTRTLEIQQLRPSVLTASALWLCHLAGLELHWSSDLLL